MSNALIVDVVILFGHDHARWSYSLRLSACIFFGILFGRRLAACYTRKPEYLVDSFHPISPFPIIIWDGVLTVVVCGKLP